MQSLAGAAAILVDGLVPAGALGLDDRLDVPVVGVPPAVAASVRSALARGSDVDGVARGARLAGERAAHPRCPVLLSRSVLRRRRQARGGNCGRRAGDRRSGEERETRTARYGTISGTSAAAALAGGAAAVLAQIRPGLDAVALKGVLVGTAARRRRSAPPRRRVRASVDAEAASAAEVIADPAAVSFGTADKPGWKAVRRVTVRNVSTRRVTVEVAAAVEGIAGVSVVCEADATSAFLRVRRASWRSRRACPSSRAGSAQWRGGHGSTSRGAA